MKPLCFICLSIVRQTPKTISQISWHNEIMFISPSGQVGQNTHYKAQGIVPFVLPTQTWVTHVFPTQKGECKELPSYSSCQRLLSAREKAQPFNWKPFQKSGGSFFSRSRMYTPIHEISPCDSSKHFMATKKGPEFFHSVDERCQFLICWCCIVTVFDFNFFVEYFLEQSLRFFTAVRIYVNASTYRVRVVII